MKITIKLINGKSKEVIFNSMPNIRELRNAVSNSFGLKWHEFTIIISDKNKKSIGSIYKDDPSDMDFDKFITSTLNKNIETLELDEITFCINLHLGPSQQHRPCAQNPRGFPMYYEIRQDKILRNTVMDNNFFLYVHGTSEKKTFKERIKILQLSDESIPEEFLDPISFEIMNRPIIASDQRSYDESTLETLNYISPFSKEKIRSVGYNLSLFSKIENFITEKENHAAIKTMYLIRNRNGLFRSPLYLLPKHVFNKILDDADYHATEMCANKVHN